MTIILFITFRKFLSGIVLDSDNKCVAMPLPKLKRGFSSHSTDYTQSLSNYYSIRIK